MYRKHQGGPGLGFCDHAVKEFICLKSRMINRSWGLLDGNVEVPRYFAKIAPPEVVWEGALYTMEYGVQRILINNYVSVRMGGNCTPGTGLIRSPPASASLFRVPSPFGRSGFALTKCPAMMGET
jgi:hypothetical protein